MNFPLFFQVEGQLSLEQIAFDLHTWQVSEEHPDESATVWWRKKWEVINPARLDTEERVKDCLANISGDPAAIGIKVGGPVWAEIIGRDVENVVKSDAICLLPGWYLSKGAKIEAFTAWQCGKEIYQWEEGALDPVDPSSEYFKMKVSM